MTLLAVILKKLFSKFRLGDISNVIFPFSFLESLLKREMAEGENDKTKSNKLPQLRQNPPTKHMGKPECQLQQYGQMPSLWKHKELEGWKTLCFFWSNSAILLPRLWLQVFICLVSQNLFPFFVSSEVFC
jgi:hypothetical protein